MKNLNKEQLEHNVEVLMGNLLRIGVLSAATIVLLGGIIYLWENGFKTPNYSFFNSEPANLRYLTSIITEAFSFHSRGLIQFGLILLVLTPVTRVIFSVVAFLYEKDYLYVVFTLIVLTVLLYSLFC